MQSGPPLADLLVVGGLTVDEFVDGTTAPGGSVIHSGRAAAREGARLAVATVCGDEPAARTGLGLLSEMGSVVRQPAATTCTYRHRESDAGRVLVFDGGTEPLRPDFLAAVPAARVTVVAPIADELPPSSLAAARAAAESSLVVLLIQGWLRDLRVGAPVRPLPLDRVDAALWTEMGAADAVVVSTEDLAEAPGDPFAQARALRASIGPKPILAVTLGVEGYLLDDPAADRLIASVPQRVIHGVPTVGAGDIFGAAFALRLARGADAAAAGAGAAGVVVAMLEERRAP